MIRPQEDSVLTRLDVGIDDLSETQQSQLAEILERYLADLESGSPVDRDALIESHPELSDYLFKFLASVEGLHHAAVATQHDASLRDASKDTATSLSSSSQIGDYIIKQEIGRGGMGIVYEARQISLGRKVALKTLPFAAVMDQKQVARFKNEAQAAAGLHHPNIVPVYGVGCERGVHYFSMQLIEGQSLEQAIGQLRDVDDARQTAQSPSKTTAAHFSTQQSIRSRHFSQSVARLGQQAAEALHYAHQQGVVHRDIKPSNLLLDASSQLWITDFGLARINAESNLTVSGDMVGTARYMSPEQASGRVHEVDYRSDIYSLGITLYELLTLKPAFEAQTHIGLLHAVENVQPIPPRKLNPSIPIELETIVLRAIEKSRDDRYSSAGELAEDLGNFLCGRPTLAKRPGVREHAFRWAVRHRNVVTTAAAVLLMMLFSVSAFALMILRERQQTQYQADQAALHLRETQRVVDNFGAMVDQRLEHLPGSSELRAELLGELEKYYSAFLRQTEGDTSYAVDLAKTQFRLAAVHQRLGDWDRAQEGYEHALRGFQEVLSEGPVDAQHQLDVALCHNNIAQVLQQVGDYAAAKQQYGVAIDIYNELKHREVADAWNGLARTQMNKGLMLWSLQDPQAEEALEQAHTTLAKLASENPDNNRFSDQLALCENNLASLSMSHDLAKAESLLRSAVARYDTLVSQIPNSPEHRRDQAVAIGNLGAVAAHQGDLNKARALLADAIETREFLVQLEPNTVAHQFDLAVAYQQLAQLQASAEDLPQAKSMYQHADQLWQEYLRDRPKDSRAQSNLARTLSNLGVIASQTGRKQDALNLLRQAESHQLVAIELSPENKKYRVSLKHHQQQISNLTSPKSQENEPVQQDQSTSEASI